MSTIDRLEAMVFVASGAEGWSDTEIEQAA